MAGKSRTCSHVGGLLWKIEYAVRKGMTGKSCTDVQAQWNKGTTRYIEPGPILGMDFKKPKYVREIDDDVAHNSSYTASSFRSFTSHSDFQSFVFNSDLKPLFNLRDSLIFKAVNADVSKISFEKSLSHSNHNGEMSCKKCMKFYAKYVQINESQIQQIKQNTVDQSQSELWFDTRKIRITGSSAHKVPVRESTNPDNFMREHMYPTFRGNIYTRYGQENEIKAKQQLRESGQIISDVGAVILINEPWLSVSPDGVLHTSDGDVLLEIKCPFLKGSIIEEFIEGDKYDVTKKSDGYSLKPHGSRGYYQQVQLTMHVTGLLSCDYVIWSLREYVTVNVPYDPEFCRAAVIRLKRFYFARFLPRIVDDFECGRLKFSTQYVKSSQ